MHTMENERAAVSEAPANLDATFRHDGAGASRLIAAIVSGDLPALRLLLRQGASPDTYFYGRPAVMWAVMQGQSETLEILLDAGADPETTTASGRRPLEIALSLRCQRSIDLLSSAIHKRRIRHSQRW